MQMRSNDTTNARSGPAGSRMAAKEVSTSTINSNIQNFIYSFQMCSAIFRRLTKNSTSKVIRKSMITRVTRKNSATKIRKISIAWSITDASDL